MNRLHAAGGSLPSLGASPHLLGAALAGLLCLTNCTDTSEADPVSAGGGANEAGAPNAAGTSSQAGKGGAAAAGTGAVSGGADSANGGAAGASIDAAGMSGIPTAGAGDVSSAGAASAAGAAGAAGAGGVGAGGMPAEAPHITSSENVGVLTEADFKARCDARNGTVEIMPHCGGFATAKGFSYDSGTQLLSEHTCQGTNTCAGWNCVID